MYLHYKIGGIVLGIETDCEYLLNRMVSFSVPCEAPDLKIKMHTTQRAITDPDGDVLINDGYVLWMRKSDGSKGFITYVRSKLTGDILALLEIDSQWKNASIVFDTRTDAKINNIDAGTYIAFHVVGVVYRFFCLMHDGLVIHSSSIDFKGKGLVFTAPAGTGKSTHVKLWETHMGEAVSVINDDTPIIRLFDGIPYLCGTPWSGSSDKFLNRCVPLTAIIVLQRGIKNEIQRLSKSETTPYLMPRCLMPYFDSTLMNSAIETYEKIITTTPVYLLKCKPDKEAMELVYRSVV